MRRATYLSSNELSDYIKTAVFAEESRAIADKTPEKDWARDLRTAATKLEKIARERIACVADDQLVPIRRRLEHTELRFVTNDDKRGKQAGLIDNKKKYISIEEDDFVLLIKIIEMAVCKNCACGDVANCELRKAFHRIGYVVNNINPAKNECEFHEKENE